MTSPESGLSEKEHLLKLAAGDAESFRYFFDHYRNRVYSLSMYLTHSEYIAEEITQEVFLKIWLTREQLQEIGNFNAYLRTVASHIISNQLKRFATEKLVLNRIAGSSDQSSNVTQNSILINEYQLILSQAIERLSPRQREVYLMSRHQGLKQLDIADKLGISVFTVKEYMKDAMASIRKFVGNRIDITILLAISMFLGE